MCRPIGADHSDRDNSSTAAPGTNRFVVAATGLLLTLLTYVWSLAIVETIARRAVFWSLTSSTRAGPILALGVGTALIAAMLARPIRRPEARVSSGLMAVHLVVISATATVAAFFRPSHWRVSDQVPELFTTWGPGATFQQAPPGQLPPPFEDRIANGELVPYLDFVVTASVIAIAIVAALSCATLLRGLIRRANSSADFGTALALILSIVLLVSFASALRLILDNITTYLSNHGLMGGEPGESAPFGARQVLPPLNPLYAGRNDWVMDLLPIVGIVGLLAIATGLLASNLLPGGAGRPRRRRFGDSDEDAARWIHALVVNLSVTLGRALLAAGLLWVALLAGVGALVLRGPETAWSVAVVVVQLVSAGVILVFVAGSRLKTVHAVVGSAADVVGFWPVTSHPLAGASYREPVVEGIQEELRAAEGKSAVLVGHSQGSVLCAWVLHHSHGRFDDVSLVTCGSPLNSLYAEFFPAFFDDRFFASLHGRSAGWTNFWRDTDPIATPMPGLASDYDIRIPDPPSIGGKVKAHGDYWVATEQVEVVQQLLHPRGSR
jgi:hypothetical protein